MCAFDFGRTLLFLKIICGCVGDASAFYVFEIYCVIYNGIALLCMAAACKGTSVDRRVQLRKLVVNASAIECHKTYECIDGAVLFVCFHSALLPENR